MTKPKLLPKSFVTVSLCTPTHWSKTWISNFSVWRKIQILSLHWSQSIISRNYRSGHSCTYVMYLSQCIFKSDHICCSFLFFIGLFSFFIKKVFESGENIYIKITKHIYSFWEIFSEVKKKEVVINAVSFAVKIQILLTLDNWGKCVLAWKLK